MSEIRNKLRNQNVLRSIILFSRDRKEMLRFIRCPPVYVFLRRRSQLTVRLVSVRWNSGLLHHHAASATNARFRSKKAHVAAPSNRRKRGTSETNTLLRVLRSFLI